MALQIRSEVFVMPGNLPAEQHVLHLRSLPDVMDHHVLPALRRFVIHHDTDVWHASSEMPSDEIARRIISAVRSYGHRFSLAAEKHHQIRDSPVVNIGIGTVLHPLPLPRIEPK